MVIISFVIVVVWPVIVVFIWLCPTGSVPRTYVFMVRGVVSCPCQGPGTRMVRMRMVSGLALRGSRAVRGASGCHS